MPQAKTSVLNTELKPLCPRDDREMHYEKTSIRWKDTAGAEFALPSYHCHDTDCSMRFDAEHGYFTVVGEPDQPFFMDEQGTNLLCCPRHGAWLYRTYESNEEARTGEPSGKSANERKRREEWRCPVNDCDYRHADNIKHAWTHE